MVSYTLKRLAQGLLLVLTVSILVFSLLYIMPGDPVELLTGERVSEARKAEIRTDLGLDRPLPQQYITWLGKVLRLDMGTSLVTKLSVRDSILHRLPITLRISGFALLVELVVAVPLGLLAAYKKDSIFDRFLMALTSFFQSVPNFWMAMLLILLFGASLQWLPLNGYGTAAHYVLPVTAVALTGIASILRMTKAEVLEVFREKYVQTAWAKGLRRRQVIIRHVLRNSLILVTVMVFMSLPWLVSGSVIIENIFIIPGMGSLLTKAIANQDFPVVQSCVLIITVLTVLCNIVSDLVTAVLDPRIRIEIGGGVK